MVNLKLALRTLFKTPFVTIVAIVSLALGIGANAAIFSLFNQMLLRPLPVQEPARLVNLSAPEPKPGSQSCNNAGDCDEVFSYAMFRDLERVQKVFTGIAAHRSFGANLAYKGQTLNGQGMLVSGSYFPVLGLQPAIGRLLDRRDDRAVGESHVAVLGYEYWQTRFGENTAVLGETLIVNGQALTVVGVAPRGFDSTTLGSRPQVFVPITMRELMWRSGSAPGRPTSFENRLSYWAYLFARLRPGVSIEQARTALNVQYHAIVNDVEAPLQQALSDQTMKRFRAKQAGVEEGARGQSDLRAGTTKVTLVLLMGVTGLVLLIACANIANLLLARGAARSAEMAVRLSIGASRWHLVAQLLAESCLLAVFGGIAGLLVARWTLHVIASLLPVEATRVATFELDPGAAIFAGVLTIATGLMFGLFPALHATRADLASALKGQAGQPSGGRAAARFRTSLATAQIALSMALLISAGLFVKSLFNVSRVNLGLDVDNVITFGISPELNGYTAQRSRALFERVEDELAAAPGVTGVSGGMVPLLSGSNWGSSVAVEGFKAGPDTDTNARFNELAPGYFRTLGIPLVSGREFTRADALGAPKVAIVNEEFAKKFNLGRSAVGRRMSTRSIGGTLDIEIVGLARNAKYSQVKDKVPPQFFLPYRQDDDLGFLTFYVRTALPPEQALGAIRKTIARLDPNLPVEDLRTMPQQVRENVFLDRLITVLSAAFAALATLLAAIGLYGVLAYTVAQRTREFGLRMALGAAPGRIRRMVLRNVAWMTVVGGTIGLGAGIALGWSAGSMLFELQGWDPGVLAITVVGLSGVALGAGLFPALRASSIDPMRALRYE
jgi:predicted permease